VIFYRSRAANARPVLANNVAKQHMSADLSTPTPRKPQMVILTDKRLGISAGHGSSHSAFVESIV
jgi:hypothetical protein